MQELIVALIVAWCCAYAAWALLPDAARRACARCVLARSIGLPAAIHGWLRRTASAPSGCACDGCDAGKKPGAGRASPAPMQAQPIRIHRIVKR